MFIEEKDPPKGDTTNGEPSSFARPCLKCYKDPLV